MKFAEISQGYILPINIDEQELMRVLEENDYVLKEDLDDFGQHLAEKMVSKGLLNRFKCEDKIAYGPNQGEE